MKNNKIKIFSFLNPFSNIINVDFFDYLRVDLEEISLINNFNNANIIISDYLISNYRYINVEKTKLIFDLAYDLYESTEKLDNFLYQLNINNISLNLDLLSNNILKHLFFKGSKIFCYNNKINTKLSLDELIEKIKSSEYINNVIIILENYSIEELNFIKSKTNSILLTNNNTNKFDGFYIKNSELLGLFDEKNKKLNFNKIYNETIEEIILDSVK